MAQVEPIRAGDVPAVADFLARFPNEKQTAVEWEARLRTWWDANPAFAANPQRGWLLREGESIVGVFGSIPLEFQFDGKTIPVYAGTTWRVLPSHRGLSMALKQRQMAEQRDTLHFSTTPAPQVVALLKVLRYRHLSEWQGGNEQSMIVFNAVPMLSRKLSRFRFAGTAARLAAPFVALWQSWKLRACTPKSLEVTEPDSAGAPFDDLWARTRGLFAHTNTRSAAWVQWYCFHVVPERKKLLACWRDGKLFGYMIVLQDPDERGIARCVDLWCDPDFAETAAGALFNFARRNAKRFGWDQLVVPHFTIAHESLCRRLGLTPRPAWDSRAYVNGPAEMLSQMTAGNTCFVGAQGDVGL